MRFSDKPLMSSEDGSAAEGGSGIFGTEVGPLDPSTTSGVTAGGVHGGPAQGPIELGPTPGVPLTPPVIPGPEPPLSTTSSPGGGLGGSGYTLPGEPPPPVSLGLEAPPESSSTGLPLTMPGGGGGSFSLPGTRGAIPFQPPGFAESRTLRGGPGVPMVGAPSALGSGDPLSGLIDPTPDDDLMSQISRGPGVRG